MNDNLFSEDQKMKRQSKTTRLMFTQSYVILILLLLGLLEGVAVSEPFFNYELMLEGWSDVTVGSSTYDMYFIGGIYTDVFSSPYYETPDPLDAANAILEEFEAYNHHPSSIVTYPPTGGVKYSGQFFVPIEWDNEHMYAYRVESHWDGTTIWELLEDTSVIYGNQSYPVYAVFTSPGVVPSTSIIPAPGAFILGSIGIGYSSWRLRKQRAA